MTTRGATRCLARRRLEPTAGEASWIASGWREPRELFAQLLLLSASPLETFVFPLCLWPASPTPLRH